MVNSISPATIGLAMVPEIWAPPLRVPVSGIFFSVQQFQDVLQIAVADGAVAEDLTVVADLPIIQPDGGLELGAQRSARDDGILRAHVLGGCDGVRLEGAKQLALDGEIGRGDVAGELRMVERSADDAVEGGAAVLQLDRHRGGAGSEDGKEIVEVAGLHVDLHLAAVDAGEIDAGGRAA